ncbi:glycosyl hydrolase [Aureimonas leprariae]|uniref:D-apionate lactonase C-terminal domain-containing protein n=1 Tax=Plantimonas leprariae TaxID=2615207 RepID=A0A7V7PPQ1_9HYPH|nr:glycosyl hydrolase [Aureimonas leprariae]KAB0679985.1 hypothetical protein F6X38_10455 [Aureimonas leprariae]
MNRRELLAGGVATAALAQAATRAAAQTAAPTAASGDPSAILDAFRSPPDDARVMMRWWLFGPGVTNEELGRELQAMRDAGLGGVELAFVYPLALGDDGDSIRNVSLLSDEFAANLRFISQRTKALGMRLDITGGSGWSYGGATIAGDLAAHQLRVETREVAPSLKRLPKLAPFDGDELVAAFVGRGSIQETPSHLEPLQITETEVLIPDGDGPRVVHLYYAGRTGQVVKRAAVGAEGYVLDHYNPDAVRQHLTDTTAKLLDAAEPGSVTCVFCDSLEVYKANWTRRLPEEFARRRGYDLLPRLPQLFFKTGSDYEAFRRDYGQTLAELYAENFLQPMQAFAKERGIRFRVQNYGVPPSTLASHRFADIANGEGWGWRTFTSSKWAASAGALFGKPVVGSETWTWAHSPAFRLTPADMRGEAHEHFLIGINQLIGHGWPYSPPEAGEPGWMFYASSALSDKNAWWPAMPDVARYLQRTSAVLRLGKPVHDVALLLSNGDALASFLPSDDNYMDLWRRLRDRLDPRIVPAILDAGNSYVAADDGTLEQALGLGVRAVVVPHLRMLEASTLERLRRFAAEGGWVVAVAADRSEVDGFQAVDAGNLSAWLTGAIGPALGIEGGGSRVGFAHRATEAEDIFFVANTGNTPRTVRLRPRRGRAHATILDAMTDTVAAAETADTVALTLQPYEARIVVFHDAPWPGTAPVAMPKGEAPQDWGSWTARIGDQPERTVSLPYDWASREPTRFYSGSALFAGRVQLARVETGKRYWLDLGESRPREPEPLPNGTLRGNSFAALIHAPVGEVARLRVNGRDAGTVWAPPFRRDVTELLREGDNEVEIEVFNTSINRMAAGGTLPDMAALADKFGQRAVLQDLDVIEPVPSGLFAQPRILST